MGNLDLLEDACEKLAHTTRAMFGGHGLFAPNGGMFAGIVDDDQIVLKLAQDPERAELIAQGGAPWVYNGKMTMKDWIVIPDRFYDEPATLASWAKRAHAIAPGKVTKSARSAQSAEGAKSAKSAKGAKSAQSAKGAKGAAPPVSPPKKALAKKTAAKKAPSKEAPAKKASARKAAAKKAPSKKAR